MLTLQAGGLEPLTRKLDRQLLSVGSDASADIRLATVPARWAILRRQPNGLEVRRIGVAGAIPIGVGESVEIDGVRIGLSRASTAPAASEGLDVEAVAQALADADAPDDALRTMLEALIEQTGARTGAIVLRAPDGYTVPVAFENGETLDDAQQLLSDTLVRDVLEGGASTLHLENLAGSARYASVPSVVSLRLTSVLCVPMRMGKEVLGAVYLGHHDPSARFSDAMANDLRVLATMALPVITQLRRAQSHASPVDELLVGDSSSMDQVRELVKRVAPSDLSVLVLGETGTGKEVTARAIHQASPRAEHPMIALNCAAVPESLLAVELFGCKKGAYTGATSDRKGRIEAADGSTLFLDEVGDMPLPMQVALLRVLEERAVTRVGENEERPVDFRLIAATSLDLDAAVESGRFRKDLLYRLRELAITLPPLRDRGDDVLMLAHLFLRQAERQLGLPPRKLSAAAQRALGKHAFEGNVRELRAVMRRSSILCDDAVIEPAHLLLDAPANAGEDLGPTDLSLADARDQFTVRYCTAVLNAHEGNREAAAAALGISVRSLYRHLS